MRLNGRSTTPCFFPVSAHAVTSRNGMSEIHTFGLLSRTEKKGQLHYDELLLTAGTDSRACPFKRLHGLRHGR